MYDLVLWSAALGLFPLALGISQELLAAVSRKLA